MSAGYSLDERCERERSEDSDDRPAFDLTAAEM